MGGTLSTVENGSRMLRWLTTGLRQKPSDWYREIDYDVAQGAHRLMELGGIEIMYYRRLNVPSHMDHILLDDWEDGDLGSRRVAGGATLAKIHSATMTYLNRQIDPVEDLEPGQQLRHAAETLVCHRRAREAEGGDRWEVFPESGS